MIFQEFSIKNEDQRVAELIEYSNVVVNMIGTRLPYKLESYLLFVSCLPG